jgi:taurine--2-oxoglutarate transaminase
VIQEDRLVERAAETGRTFARHLRELGEAHACVGDVRSIGLFGAIELVRDRSTRQPLAPFNASSPEMEALRKRLLERGLFAYTHWHTLLLLPPLIISLEQLAEGFAIIDEALANTDQSIRT